MMSSSCAATGLDPEPKPSFRQAPLSNSPFRARNWNIASAIFLFTARVIAAIAQLKYIERFFGGPFSGLTVVSNQVLLYVTLLELGLSQAAISFLYEPILSGDSERTSALLTALRSDMRRLIAIGSLVVFPVLAIYGRFLHSRVPYSTIVAALWMVAITAFIQLSAVHFQSYLNAAERLGWVNLILGCGYLVKTAIGLAVAVYFGEYLWLPGTIALLTIVEFLLLRLAFTRHFPQFRPDKSQWAINTIRHRARFALIHKVSGVAYYQSDFIILSLTAGLIAVKNYAKYQYISAALLSIMGTVAIAVTASFAYSQLKKQAEARFRQYAQLQFVVAVLGAIACLGFFYVSPDVVRWAFGQAEIVGRWPLVLFAAALFLNVVKIADDMMITARGAFRPGYGIPIAEVPIYITLGVLLSDRFGFVGILVASAATNLLISVLVKGILLSRPVFDASRARWFTRRALNVGMALLLVTPLMPLHWAAERAFSSAILRVGFWCGSALIYGFLILRVFAVRSGGTDALISSPEMEP
jgi:O-antigen/teichoic acid export membrane protein